MDQPITGDRYVSMNHGPVLSGVYDLIKGQSINDALPLWSEFISTPQHSYISLIKDPGSENLCEEEGEILKQVYQTFGNLDPFHVAEWTHDLPEWQNPHGSAIPIAVEDILKSLGKSSEEILEIQQQAGREAYLDKVLNG
jgi:hypothetical protein